ncbi:MAG: hypothetical protein INR62_06970 [Rhodospirillales bacterium]|nr:hypothetical protein [Acetobacter sp.]
MKRFLALVLAAAGICGLEGCAHVVGTSIASSGRSGCNNIDMASADIRNDPANGLPPVPRN